VFRDDGRHKILVDHDVEVRHAERGMKITAGRRQARIGDLHARASGLVHAPDTEAARNRRIGVLDRVEQAGSLIEGLRPGAEKHVGGITCGGDRQHVITVLHFEVVQSLAEGQRSALLADGGRGAGRCKEYVDPADARCDVADCDFEDRLVARPLALRRFPQHDGRCIERAGQHEDIVHVGDDRKRLSRQAANGRIARQPGFEPEVVGEVVEGLGVRRGLVGDAAQ
jgi:hypothetical protein